MSDASSGYKWDEGQRTGRQQDRYRRHSRTQLAGEEPQVELIGSCSRVCLKIAHSVSGIFRHTRDVFGRRRSITTNEY